tara:strand:+ start:22502 stop:27136 length:4635 start_codon:yes stop_codon:yes gene_type:complete
MELSKPVIVKRWLSETNYKTYVFDTNKDNTYKSSYTIISEYIFQDNSCNEALDKIAYYIMEKEKDIQLPYYFWDNENLLYDIKEIKWSGYNVNPFKSKDRSSETLKEPIEISNKHGLFKRTNINIVFYNDFNYDIKYYYDRSIKASDFAKKIKELIKSEEILISLYKNVSKYAKISLEEYNDVSFNTKINIESLLTLFDNLETNNKIQIIQLTNHTNNAIYKLYKEHNFLNEKELGYIFNIVNKKDESLNIYYKGKNSKLIVYENNALINFKYPIDNGNKIDKIISEKNELVEYISNYISKEDLNFVEEDINLRLKIIIDNVEYPALIKKIGYYVNVFEAIIFKNEKKKNSGYYSYKRVNDVLNDKFDITKYIKSRLIVGLTEDDIIKELIVFGYTKTEVSKLVKQELERIGDIDFNNLDKNPNIIDGTYIIVKKSGGGFEIDIKNCKSYYELDNIKYWLTRIVDQTRAVIKKPIVVKKENTPPPVKKKTSSSSSSSSNDNIVDDDMEFDLSFAKGGNKNNENKNYLINRLRNADKELYQDNNKSRKCQKEHQPVVLSKEEYDEIKTNGYDKYFDNVIEYGSKPEIKNYYTCPRLWCPISKIPIDDTVENPKCPGDNEEPMKLNEEMKNLNKPRYSYLMKNINLPCCGKKKPKEDLVKSAKLSNKKVIPNDVENIENIEIKEEDKNYIMNKIPLPYKGRYGDISKEFYNILKPDSYLEYTKFCSSPNNINKKECILRKSIIDFKNIPYRYDNIINVVAYLLNKTKEEFIIDIVDKLDIITYLSLDNGNVCKDFVDLEPIIAEDNSELYKEFVKYNKKFKSLNIDLPDIEDKTKEANIKKSRLLYIYKSYLKFIKYLSSDNFPYDKTVKYLHSLVAILYKRLIVLWEIERIDDNVQMNILCPYYTRFIELQAYLDKSQKFIMIFKENNYYEPIISKSIHMKLDKKNFNLEEYPVIKDILINCTKQNNFIDYDINIFTKKENINSLNRLLKEESELFVFQSIIINTDYTIDKIILKNNTILTFKKQSIIILPLLIKEFDIKNVIFYDDIIGKEFKIKVVKDIYEKFKKGFEKIKAIGFNLDIGENILDTNEIMRNKLKIKEEKYETVNANLILPFDNKYKYYDYYNKNNKNEKYIEKIRLHIKQKLLNSKFTDEYYKNLSLKSRKKIIKKLLDEFKESSFVNKIKDIQIILEEIPISSRNNIKKWYKKSLLYTKYDYINELSNKIKDNGKELLFTQYAISDKIPKNIIRYHDALPNSMSNVEESTQNYKLPNKTENYIIELPTIFKGDETILNSKWTKYKKKIWFKLRYVKNNYSNLQIEELFKYLLNKYDINMILSYQNVIDEVNKYYIDLFNKDNLDKNKNSKIKRLFKDPHFYLEYVKEMNNINKTKKSFKTLRIFMETYFDKSSNENINSIINNIITKKLLSYPSDVNIYYISNLLNITILVIHNRSEYGKGVKVNKRAGDKDLNITTSIFKANKNIETRPLIILYRKIEKTHISYYIIKNSESAEYFYIELQDAPDDIKNKILNSNLSNNDLSSSTSTSSI